MDKIVVVTIKGCECCKIMCRIIREVLAKRKVEIAFEAKESELLDKKFLKTFNIKDFPTILFFKEGALKFKYTGTMPASVINRWIDIHLK